MQYPVPLFSLCTKSLIAGARSPLFLNAQKKIISTGAEHCYVARSLRRKRFRRVWEQRKTEERGVRYFACAENGARAKKRTVGVEEGTEGTACGQTPGF